MAPPMEVHCNKCAKNLRGVRKVWASPEKGLVVVYGTPYYCPETAHYGPSQPKAYGWDAPPPQAAYYSQPPLLPPPASYPYPAGGYVAVWADPDPYVYAAHSTVPTCSIL